MDAADLPWSTLVSEPAVEVHASRRAAARRALERVEDPEIPALSIVDLGLVRSIEETAEGVLCVGLSPTYTGCPATEVIRERVHIALLAAGLHPVRVDTVLAPPWSTDWITPDGRAKLAACGIAPPTEAHLPAACPRCGSLNTERLSHFGSTPCKALHRCRRCLEPFEAFKCL